MSPSTICSSLPTPRVQETSDWVSPRWNRAEPWVRGKTPTSIVSGRICSNVRPSARTPFSMMSWRVIFFSSTR